MPNYLQDGKHFTEHEMKMTTTSLFIFGVVSACSAGLFSDWLIRRKGLRFSRRFIAMICYTMMALLVFLSTEATSHMAVSACLISAFFFLPISVVNSFGACVDIGGERACTLAGIMNFFGQTGAFLMSIFFGRIVDFTHSFDAPQLLMAGVLMLGAFLWVGIDVSRKIILTAPDATSYQPMILPSLKS
jgi:ACS family glucarate transporter-like MFS transporter